MNRRQILQTGVAAALSGAASLAPLSTAYATSGSKIRKPRRLAKGDTVGLIAPASNAGEDESIRFTVDLVQSLGFHVKEGKYLYRRNQYLAGTDQERAEDVNTMFDDDEVDAIFCTRGGYGTPRILPYLDYDLIANNPKVFLGFSDNTAILAAMHVKSRLIGFHGPNMGQNLSDYTLAEFKKVLVNPSPTAYIGQAPAIESREGFVERTNRITRITGGIATGHLVGGNLSLVATLIGTPYEPDFRGSILFLEDTNEAPYRIDRMLTQLWLAGKLQQAAGIAFGKFTKADDEGNTFSIEEVIRMRCEPLGIPVIRGLMIGHVQDKTVVPIGLPAKLDADAGTLQLLEAAVS
jgi:muramoyltetrapeptide carboxypeptidase